METTQPTENNLTLLTAGTIFSEAFALGIKNYLSVLGALLLWGLTIWVPYINVGTTIAMMTLPAVMARGESISPLEIFNPKYRQFMGEMFILLGVRGIATVAALYFMVVPAIVLSLTWLLAPLLLIDKGRNPMEALAESNLAMAGYKWTVFFGALLIILVFTLGGGLIFWLLSLVLTGSASIILGLLAILTYAFLYSVQLGAQATIYEKLTK